MTAACLWRKWWGAILGWPVLFPQQERRAEATNLGVWQAALPGSQASAWPMEASGPTQ